MGSDNDYADYVSLDGSEGGNGLICSFCCSLFWTGVDGICEISLVKTPFLKRYLVCVDGLSTFQTFKITFSGSSMRSFFCAT
jgi:hypothetical protein